MLTCRGGQKVEKGTYWNLRNGIRIDVEKEGVLPGSHASIYLRMPSVAMPLLGAVVGLLYVVLFPFIGLAVLLKAAGRKLAAGAVNLAGKTLSFHWKPKSAYLTGKKKSSSGGRAAGKSSVH